MPDHTCYVDLEDPLYKNFKLEKKYFKEGSIVAYFEFDRNRADRNLVEKMTDSLTIKRNLMSDEGFKELLNCGAYGRIIFFDVRREQPFSDKIFFAGRFHQSLELTENSCQDTSANFRVVQNQPKSFLVKGYSKKGTVKYSFMEREFKGKLLRMYGNEREISTIQDS